MEKSSYEQRVEQLKQLTLNSGEFVGQRPRCRMCQKGVDHWAWHYLAPNMWEFQVQCHGDVMTGVVRERSPGFTILEVFCDTDPHINNYWWVCTDGRLAQESVQHIAESSKPGFFNSTFAKWIRKNPDRLGLIMALPAILLMFGQFSYGIILWLSFIVFIFCFMGVISKKLTQLDELDNLFSQPETTKNVTQFRDRHTKS